MKIRKLKADEIELRVGVCNEKGFSLLLYKDARVDRTILDETFGIMNWKNDFEIIDNQLFASVSIYDEEKKCWVTKKDVGTESKAEKEKGRASDAFKRACFKLGIGAELYSSPFIWIKGKTKENNKGKYAPTFFNFSVQKIVYDDNKIKELSILGDGKVIFSNFTSAVKGFEKDHENEEIGLNENQQSQKKNYKEELKHLFEIHKIEREKQKEFFESQKLSKKSTNEDFRISVLKLQKDFKNQSGLFE